MTINTVLEQSHGLKLESFTEHTMWKHSCWVHVCMCIWTVSLTKSGMTIYSYSCKLIMNWNLATFSRTQNHTLGSFIATVNCLKTKDYRIQSWYERRSTLFCEAFCLEVLAESAPRYTCIQTVTSTDIPPPRSRYTCIQMVTSTDVPLLIQIHMYSDSYIYRCPPLIQIHMCSDSYI